ncbi:hypothetical protein [Fibrobacter sp. UWP2]|uniref:hypothetical protein n=1 Tax=Fibrobacter sp. UWP2 TaxID=1896216 RepID=UPI0009222648|nr:hypothetical protein [Fibrobacter sp. UWP2]SHJ52340.1 hypothetical protein SAMN05720471_1561 [Fibrobacter sp. UWP2]
MTMGNSPFGAWVVCVYRIEASLEPRLGKCNDLRLFCILKNREVLCRTRRSSEIQPERAGVFCSFTKKGTWLMDNKEQKENFVKKVGKIFNDLDNKVCNIQQNAIERTMQTRKNSVGWLFIAPFLASDYSDATDNERTLTRICITGSIATITLFILFAYINQWFPSFTELSPKVKVAVRAVCWTALTFCLMILWKKFSIVTVRLFSCLFVLGLFELLGLLLFDYLEITSSIPAIVVLVIVSVFFLIWNFWPKPNADNVIEPYDDK